MGELECCGVLGEACLTAGGEEPPLCSGHLGGAFCPSRARVQPETAFPVSAPTGIPHVGVQ